MSFLTTRKVLGLISILLFLIACQTTSSSSTRAYTINKSTGLYSAFDIDANQVAVLAVGTKVVPADGANTLFCDSISESAMTFTLCKVEVVNTGQSGWVLKQWID